MEKGAGEAGRGDGVTITVYGLPAPQGSKRFVGMRKGKGVMIESSKAVKPWREAVKYAALDAMCARPRLTGPVYVRMVFAVPRPKSAKKGALPSKRPDLSKLVRATEDALTDAGVWEDDARIVKCVSEKWYAGDGIDALDRPGCIIKVEEI